MNKKIAFIFPHPDDEAFPTGGTIAKYGHTEGIDTYLYTLTRGESSRNARYLDISPEELAAVRADEVRESARILGVTEFRQGDYPDKRIQDMDPRILERDIEEYLLAIRPDVVVTFDVQGGSGHPDHIILHHVVKRVFLELKEKHGFPRRLAGIAMPADLVKDWTRRVMGTPRERIDAEIPVKQYKEIELQAILAHESMRRDFEEHNYDNWMLWEYEYYAFFQEDFDPPVNDLLAGM
jgi:LmbE family N-acetylglucosaminyl deacetylase